MFGQLELFGYQDSLHYEYPLRYAISTKCHLLPIYFQDPLLRFSHFLIFPVIPNCLIFHSLKLLFNRLIKFIKATWVKNSNVDGFEYDSKKTKKKEFRTNENQVTYI